MAKYNTGFSLIEIAISMIVMGILTTLVLTNYSLSTSDQKFKNDVTDFIESSSYAKSLADSGNSTNCTINEKLNFVTIRRPNTTNTYTITSYCLPISGLTPTPYNIITKKTQIATLNKASTTYANYYYGSVVTPSAGNPLTFTNGTKNCVVTIDTVGNIVPTGTTCP